MDIIHGLDIETTAEKLFEALSTDKGIANWWTKAKTQAKVGGINEFSLGPGAVTFRVEKLEPGKAVAWSAEQVPPDWNGTQVPALPRNGSLQQASARMRARSAEPLSLDSRRTLPMASRWLAQPGHSEMLSSLVAAGKFTSSAPTATPFGLPIHYPQDPRRS